MATTTLQATFVSESAAYRNVFGWYNAKTGEGGILFKNIEAEGSSPTVVGGVSKTSFTVDSADVGDIQYFLISDGASLNSSSDLSGPIKVIYYNGQWVVARADSAGNVIYDHGQPDILSGRGAPALFTETSKNAGGVDYASSTVGSNQTSTTLGGDTRDGATGQIAWEDIAATRNCYGSYSKPGDADYNDAVFKVSVLNCSPTLNDTKDPGAVTELLNASAQNLAAMYGTFTVSDTDYGDTLTPSVVGSPLVKLDGVAFTLPAGAAALIASGAFTLSGGSSNCGTVSIGYKYDPAAANLDFLREGQKLTITYTVRVFDGTCYSNTQDVTFTICGTNDAPILSDTTDPLAVKELLDASAQDLAPITGSFALKDLDVGDTLTASIVGSPVVKLDGAAFSLPPGAAALIASGAFTISPTTQTSNGGNATAIGYTYDPAAANLDFLREGQKLTITYAVKVFDGIAYSATQDVTFTICGTNDAPILSDTTDPAPVKELLDASAQDLAPLTGSFALKDLDVGDTLTASIVGSPVVKLDGAFSLPPGAAALIASGAFSISPITQTSNGGNATAIGYTYDPAAVNLDFLREGQKLTITYAVKVFDGIAYSATQDVTFTICGTNDAPILSDTTDPAPVKELLDASAQDLAPLTGSFPLSDLDVGDTLTASVVGGPVVKLDGGAFSLPPGAAALIDSGAFNISPITQTSNGGTATSIGYTYDPGAANLDFLREGQTLTITYQVKVNDGIADSVAQDVTFTIIGTNDAPVLTDTTDPAPIAEAADASAQDIGPIAGSFPLSDLDVGDTLTASVVGNPVVKLDGTTVTTGFPPELIAPNVFSITPVTQTSNGGTATSIGYTYDPAAANLDFLKEGQILTITYQVKVNDGTVDSTTQDVTFTIVGKNDTAIITTVGPDDRSVVEAGGHNISLPPFLDTPGDPSASGQLSVYDADTGEGHFVAPATLHGTYGEFTFDTDTGIWTYTLDQTKANPLSLGQLATDQLTVQTVDGTTTQVVVNITGADDNPTDITFTPSTASAESDGSMGAGFVLGTFTAIDVDSTVFRYAPTAGTGTGPTTFVLTPNASTLTNTATLSVGSAGLVANHSYEFSITASDSQFFQYREVFHVLTGSTAGDVAWVTGTGSDITLGLGGGDIINGGGGDDTLVGGSGADALNGGAGNDTLVGGAEADSLTGDLGNDRFVFTNVNQSTPAASDTVVDFVANTSTAVSQAAWNGDKLDFSAIDGDAAPGVQHLGLFGEDASGAVHQNQVSWYEDVSNNRTIVQADTNGDTTADLQVTLNGVGLNLNPQAFLL